MFVLSGLFHACLDNNSGDEVHQGYADQEHVAEEVQDQGRLVSAWQCRRLQDAQNGRMVVDAARPS